jgi:hypothetical protein
MTHPGSLAPHSSRDAYPDQTREKLRPAFICAPAVPASAQLARCLLFRTVKTRQNVTTCFLRKFVGLAQVAALILPPSGIGCGSPCPAPAPVVAAAPVAGVACHSEGGLSQEQPQDAASCSRADCCSLHTSRPAAQIPQPLEGLDHTQALSRSNEDTPVGLYRQDPARAMADGTPPLFHPGIITLRI